MATILARKEAILLLAGLAFRFDPAVLRCPGWARLEGYWQTERYFADVAERIRSDFRLAAPIVFVDPLPAGREAEDMHLMAACRHHIVANSSFSWWGAWLNPRSDKKVIAPQRWFNAAKDTCDLIPPGWVRL